MELELAFDNGTLVLAPAGLEDALIPTGFVPDERIGGKYRGEAFLYRRALASLIRSNHPVSDKARNYSECNFSHRLKREPYPHQQEALDSWILSGKAGCVVLPTGSGKTYVAELAIEAVGRSTLILVPTLDLVAQWARRLELAFGCPVGTLGGGSFDVQELTVSTYDSAYLHMDRLGNRFGLLVFDEVHHLPSEAFSQAAELAIAPFRLGLTATLERTDGAHEKLRSLVGPVVSRKKVSDLAGEYLSDYEVIRVNVNLTDDERAQYDEARAEYLGFLRQNRIRMAGARGWQRFIQASSRSAAGRSAFQAYQNQRRIALASESKMQVLEQIFGEHRSDPTIFFANDNRTVHQISERFLVPVITHETSVKERRTLLAGLETGRWNVLGTSRVLNEGVDMPDVTVGIIMSGTGSVREHVQRLGRILRRREGKHAVLYEMVTAGTVDSNTSERRRNHEAYR